MAVWMVRAGAQGEREEFAISNSVVVIGWEELPDLTTITSREELDSLCRETYPDEKPKTVTNWVGQVWAFRQRIEKGDLVALPLKTQSAIALGYLTSDYQYRPDFPPDARHCRSVRWVTTDLPRTAFDQDLLYSLGAFLTVCQIRRNNAEQRIRGMLHQEPQPARGRLQPDHPDDISDDDALLDLEGYARDQIRIHLGQKFRGHELTRLVTAILRAQGYQTQMAPPGADGGVDIIAGRGPLGFDSPRLIVQVKSSDEPIGVNVLRELRGVLPHFGADQGLLVSWGGFRQSVISEARQLFFQIRLWDAGSLVEALLLDYDRLPEDLRTELPLKRVWALVLEQ